MELLDYTGRIDFTTKKKHKSAYKISQYKSFILEFSYNLATVLELTGKWEKGVQYLKKAVNLSKVFNDRKKEAQLKDLMGKILLHQGNYAKASLMIEEVRHIGEETDDNELIAEALRSRALLYINVGDFDKAIESNHSSISISKEIGNERNVALNLAGLGNVYIYLRKYDDAISYYKKAVKIFEKYSNRRNIAIITGNIGVMYTNKGEFDNALEYYTKSLNLFKELGDKSGIARQLLNIGVINNQYKMSPDKALDYYNKALNLYKELDEKSGIARLLGNIGGIYSENLGQFENALKHYNESLEIRKKLGDKRGIARTLLYKGILYQNFGKYEKAVRQHEESIQIMKEIKLNADLGYNYSFMCNSLIKLNKINEALICINNHLDNIEESGVKTFITRTFLAIAIIMGRITNRKIKQDLHIEQNLNIITKRLGWNTDSGEVFHNVISLCRKDKTDSTLIIPALIEYANYLKDCGNVEKADQYMKEANESAKRESKFIKVLRETD